MPLPLLWLLSLSCLLLPPEIQPVVPASFIVPGRQLGRFLVHLQLDELSVLYLFIK